MNTALPIAVGPDGPRAASSIVTGAMAVVRAAGPFICMLLATEPTLASPPAPPPAGTQAVAPPHTPEGLARCINPLTPARPLFHGVGETIRYLVDVGGISVGTIDFKVERQGAFSNLEVTEYRSHFKLDPLVSALLPVEGRAAALVPLAGHIPIRAMSNYQLGKNHFEEAIGYAAAGRSISSERKKNGILRSLARLYPKPVLDFVSGFYALRSFADQAEGCTIIFGNQQAYTVWLSPTGTERIDTPVGPQTAERYAVRYGADKSKRVLEGTVWMSTTEDRLPYRVQVRGKRTLDARIHTYEIGQGE